MSLNVGVLDLETSMAPTLHPWHKDSFLSTAGLWMYLGDNHYYKDWVFTHDEYNEKKHGTHLNSFIQIQNELDKLDLLVGHNFKFDIDWLKWYNLSFDHLQLWDTKLAQFMIVGQNVEWISKHLSDACEYWGLETKDDRVKKYWDAGRNTNTIPLSNVLLPYQMQDVKITGDLFKKQWVYLKQNYPRLFELVKIRANCLHPVTEIETNGMPFDRSKSEYYVDKFTKELDLIDAELKSYFGRGDININSGRDLSASLFGGTIKREREVTQVYTKKVTYKEPFKYKYRSGKRKGLIVTKYRNKKLDGLFTKQIKQDYERTLQGVGFVPDPKTEGKDRDGQPNGIFKTNKDVLKMLKCNSKGGTTAKLKKKIIKLLIDRSKIGKFCETFVGTGKDTGLFYRADLNSDGLLHPSYNQTIAATGRFTSSNPELTLGL